MRLIVWDLEIARTVDEAGGWEGVRLGRAGIGSLVLYDSATHRSHVYGPDVAWDGQCFVPSGLGTLEAAADHLNSADVLVGFNSISFDTPVFENVTGLALDVPQYDILDEVWTALDNERHKGYRLNEIAKRTIDREKTAKGSSAPDLFKQGKFFELIDYNTNDVYLTLDLCNFIEEHGYIIDANGDKLNILQLGETIN